MAVTRIAAYVALTTFFLAREVTAQQDSVSLLTGERAVAELGAAVTVLDVDSLRRGLPVRTLAELLTGRVPGLVVRANSGSVGAAPQLFIRGASSLGGAGLQVYVDGIRVDDEPATLPYSVGGQTTSRLDDLNVEDIATIAILPGPAAAALYGTDATDGVLLVTTKLGQAGRPRVTAFTSQGVVAPAGRFPDNYLALDSSGFQCAPSRVAAGVCRLLRTNMLENPLTSPLRDGYVRQYGVGASGGGPTTRYFVAAQWDGLGGVYGLPGTEQARLLDVGGLHPEALNPNYVSRLSLRGKGRVLAGSQGDITLGLGYFYGDLRLPLNDSSAAGVLRSGLLGSADTTFEHGWGYYRPGDIFQVLNAQRVEQVTASVAATWRPLGFFTARAAAGLDRADQHDEQLQRPGEGPNGDPQRAHSAEGRLQSNRYTLAVTAAVAFPLSASLTARTTGGVEYFKHGGNQFDSSATTFGSFGLFSTLRSPINATTTGLFLEQQFAWNDRFFLTALLRRDKTGVLGRSTPAQLAPHVGVSWRLPTDESAVLSSLRLRGAYGAASRTPAILNLPALLAVLPTGGSEITPERTRELEAGVDAELLRGRLTFGATVYTRRTSKLLVLIPTIPGAGFGPLLNDSNEVGNKGIELALAASVLRRPQLSWDIGLSAWGNRNRVTHAPLPFLLSGGPLSQIAQAGLPLASYYGRPILGYADANHDGVLTPDEIQFGPAGFLGTPLPTEGATLSTTLALRRRVRIAALAEYRSGNRIANYTEATRCLAPPFNCRARNDPTAPFADQAALVSSLWGSSAGWLESARFLKLREVAVSLVAPASWARRLGAGEMAFTLAGRNLATWTGYRGIDPEVNASGAQLLTSTDFFTQPLARYWTARLDLTF